MRLLLFALMATGATAFMSVNSQESVVPETDSMLFKGTLLRSFKIDDLEVIEPYIAIQATDRARVAKTPIGKGYYFTVPLIVDSDLSATRDGKKLNVMRLTSLTVSLKKHLIDLCDKDCSELSVTSLRQQDEHSVIFRCVSQSVCQRMFNALHFNTTSSEFIRSALQFTVYGVGNGRSLRLVKEWVPVVHTSERPFPQSLWFEGDKLILYTIKAASGENAYQSFVEDRKFSIPPDGSLPDVYRSELLNDLQKVLATRSGDWEMVAEMRVGDDPVAQVVFDVSVDRESIDATNWFNPSRVKSSYPFWVGRSNFNFFSAVGDAGGNRHFFINNNYGGCDNDAGFWVVSDSRDGCPWANAGWKERIPTLIYNRFPGKYQTRGAAYAERFFVYLRYSSSFAGRSGSLPNSFQFEGSKLLLFTIRAGIGRDALATYMNRQTFPIPGNNALPDVYRSDLLDTLSDAVSSSGKKFIVAEMRVANKPVSQVFFDASINRQALNKESWFSADRVVSSSPFFVGTSGFNFFSVKGDDSPRRNFFINYNYGGCDADAGFWVVSDAQDGCSWANRFWTGKAPVLTYSTVRNSPYIRTGAKADQFLVYLV